MQSFKTKLTKQYFIAVLLAMVGLAVSLVIGHMQTENTQERFESAIQTVKRRNVLYQKKHAGQKAMVAQFRRKADRLEDEIESLRRAKAAKKADVKSAGNRKARLTARLENNRGKVAALKDAITRLQDEYGALKTEQKKRQQAYKELVAAHETEEREFVNKIGDLERRFNGTYRVARSCMDRNARLCLVVDGILEAFHDKGVGSSLLAKEPVTQLKQVHVEKVVQHYQEKIREFKQDSAEWDRHY
ncbi:MAG: hypothetical protein SWH68_03000 [Thermodesulfobacteriota bacterium]|nr:hypothetical protein [Thermodesulfobacteriota bacterium]